MSYVVNVIETFSILILSLFFALIENLNITRMKNSVRHNCITECNNNTNKKNNKKKFIQLQVQSPCAVYHVRDRVKYKNQLFLAHIENLIT